MKLFKYYFKENFKCKFLYQNQKVTESDLNTSTEGLLCKDRENKAKVNDILSNIK